jgi:hypothetical protein
MSFVGREVTGMKARRVAQPFASQHIFCFLTHDECG